MLNLTTNLVNVVEYRGRKYRLNLSFDNVLRFFELLEDKTIEEFEKLLISLEMFVYRFDLLRFDSPEEMVAFYKFILKTYLDIDLDQEKQTENTTKVMDYSKDAELIYASFFAAYKIDLLEEQGRLDYRKFKALLNALDENSAFKKAVSYRVVKIPSTTQYNKEQVEHLRKMKQFYSLEQDIDEETAQQNVSSGFAHLAQFLGKSGGVDG